MTANRAVHLMQQSMRDILESIMEREYCTLLKCYWPAVATDSSQIAAHLGPQPGMYIELGAALTAIRGKALTAA